MPDVSLGSQYPLKYIDNGDGTYSLSVGAGVTVAGGPATYSGPTWTPVRTYTTSTDISTAAAITAAPTSGKAIYLDELIVSVGTSIQMETSANVLASVFLLANTAYKFNFPNGLLGDAINKKLFGKASVSGQVRVWANYHSV
jgi:hypothetical protein